MTTTVKIVSIFYNITIIIILKIKAKTQADFSNFWQATS